MKIALYVYSLACGGAERFVSVMANWWASRGWDVVVVTTASVSEDFYELDPRVSRVVIGGAKTMKGAGGGLAGAVRRVLLLRRFLKDQRPNAALGVMSSAGVTLALARLGMSEMICIGAERSYPPQLPLTWWWTILRRWTYGSLDSVVALTEAAKEWLVDYTQAKHVSVIPNSVVWPLASQPPRLTPSKFVSMETRMLLAVGRLSEEKRFDRLIRVFQALADQHKNWVLCIIGDGFMLGRLQALVVECGLVGRVHLPGRVGNVDEWYCAADLYVLCSRFEGFPNSLLEAMACGVPPVSFDCLTGPRDIITDGVDGRLVANGNFDALKECLSELMADQTLRTQYGGRAVEVRDRFSIETIAASWETLISDLARTPGDDYSGRAPSHEA